jgi:hypothetical protein
MRTMSDHGVLDAQVTTLQGHGYYQLHHQHNKPDGSRDRSRRVGKILKNTADLVV